MTPWIKPPSACSGVYCACPDGARNVAVMLPGVTVEPVGHCALVGSDKAVLICEIVTVSSFAPMSTASFSPMNIPQMDVTFTVRVCADELAGTLDPLARHGADV